MRAGSARSLRLSTAVTVGALVLTACPSGPDEPPVETGGWGPAPRQIAGLSVLAEAKDSRFVTHTASGERGFLFGINLGATLPGRQPGQVNQMDAATYARWFAQMGALGVHAIRIYTIHPPAFYEELLTYNEANPGDPLYLVAGVYPPDEEYIETEDLWANTEAFASEIEDAMDALAGRLNRPVRPGRAGGRYTADLRPWLQSVIIGAELDGSAAHASDIKNADRPQHRGIYFSSTSAATPTERWYAMLLDRAAIRLAEMGISIPMAIVGWPTTDPLRHPLEPYPLEDLFQLDTNNIEVDLRSWPGGLFASYHAYPYYPDFLRFEERYQRFRYRGRTDPYAGYLAHLKEHHGDIPVVITELGVPSSIGTAHLGPLGRGQGDHDEPDSMRIVGDLVEMALDLELGGALAFEWADEWFKLTWNTVDLQSPSNRRSLWYDPWTNEQHFGLLAVEPASDMVTDGDLTDWGDPASSQAIAEDRGPVRLVRATHDPGYLRLMMKLAEDLGDVTLGFDTVRGGAGGLPSLGGTMPAADIAVHLPESGDGQAFMRPAIDPLVPLFVDEGFLSLDRLRSEDPRWHEQHLMVNRPYDDPRGTSRIPAELFDIGLLRRGTDAVGDPERDSRVLWQRGPDGIEIKIPWLMLGLSDPSSRRVWLPADGGERRTDDLGRIRIGVWANDSLLETAGYAWDTWSLPEWQERPKEGVSQLCERLAALGVGARDTGTCSEIGGVFRP